jgi:hypothetical protein
MRKVPLAGAAAALVLGLAGVVSFAAVSQAAGPSPAKSQTLVFDVVFSPFELVQANNVRVPNSPFALGDEIVAHDQLFSHGQRVGDDAISCVIVSVPPDPSWPIAPAYSGCRPALSPSRPPPFPARPRRSWR